MVMRHVVDSRRYWVAVFGLCVTAAVIGGTLAFIGLPAGNRTVLQEFKGTALAANGPSLKLVDPGSDKIEFPPYLAGLQGQPSDIAFDKAGHLWITWTQSDGQLVLAQGDLNHSQLSQYTIPANKPGPEPRLAIDGRGDLIIGVGREVVRVNSSTLDYKSFGLSASPGAVGATPGADGTITGLRVDGESAFVSRFGSQSITELSLDSGNSNELAVPDSFGGFDDFIVSNGALWLLKIGDTVKGPPSQVGRFDLSTASFRVISTRVRAAAADGDGLMVLNWAPDGTDRILHVDSAGSQRPVSADTLTGVFLGRLGDSKVLSDGRGGFWLTDIAANMVAWISPGTGATNSYALPAWEIPRAGTGCPPGTDCSGSFPVHTNISGVAVSPNGDLYFADTSLSRIGLISSH
jgi:hypothetical protein